MPSHISTLSYPALISADISALGSALSPTHNVRIALLMAPGGVMRCKSASADMVIAMLSPFSSAHIGSSLLAVIPADEAMPLPPSGISRAGRWYALSVNAAISCCILAAEASFAVTVSTVLPVWQKSPAAMWGLCTSPSPKTAALPSPFASASLRRQYSG